MKNNITPGDFAIMLTNIPKDKTEVDVKMFIRMHLEKAEIEDVNLAYDIREIVKKIRKMDRLKRISLNPEKYKDKYNIEEVQEDLARLGTEVQTIKEEMGKSDSRLKSTGIAFVILNKQSQAEEIVYKFKSHFLIKFINFVLIKIFR